MGYIHQLCIKTINARIYWKKYENICDYCLDGKFKMITLFNHSKGCERAREIKIFINCCSMTLQATCTSKNLQWSRWIDEYAIKDFENVCFKNKLLSKSLTIKAHDLQKCHCSFFLVSHILSKAYLCLWEWASEMMCFIWNRFETIFVS